MKYKLLLITLMAILMAGIVYGAFSIVVPTTNEYVTGAVYKINGTPWVGDVFNGNCSNVTVDYRVSGGSSYTSIGVNNSLTNITGNWSLTFNTQGLKDDTIYSMRARCKNATNQAVLVTATEVQFKVDNTKPKCTHSQSSKTTYKPDQTWTVTGTNGSSATIQFGANAALAMSEASDVFTYTSTKSTLPENTYNPVTAAVSDGLNITSCSLDYVTISSKSGLVQVAATVATQGQKQAEQAVTTTSSNKNLLIGLLLAALAFWYVRRRKN